MAPLLLTIRSLSLGETSTADSAVQTASTSAPQKQVVPRQSALSLKEIELSTHSQLVPRQSALTPMEIVLFPLRQVPPNQRVLAPRQPAPHRQVVHRQLSMAPTPREIVLFPLRQVVPGQRVLMPRQPAPLPKQSALTPR